MAAQFPAAVPSFTGMVGASTDPLSSPSLVTYAQKCADEIVALANNRGLGIGPYPTGLWHSSEVYTTGSHAPAAGTMVVIRQDFPPGTVITQLGEWIVTAATAGGVRRLGIYSDDGTGYPGALLKDAGTYDATVGSGVFASVTAFTAVPVGGTVWFAGVAQTAAATVTGATSNSRSMAMATVVNGNQQWTGYTQTGVTAGLPSNFTTTRATTTSAPRLFFKTG